MFAASKTSAAAAGAPPASTDPQFNYVSLLLNDTGTNGQQNNTFLDSSTNNFTITRNGTPTQGSVTPYWPDGQWSNYFPANTSNVSVASNAAFAFPGQFTVEAWFCWTTTPSAGQVTGVLASGGFNITYNTTLQFNLFGTGAIASATFTPVIGRWYHIAMTRNSSNICTVWIDGVSSATGTSSASFAQGAWTLYGGSNNGGAGYVSNLRIVKGTALYTSNFTPSTTPLTAVSGTSLLTCQSNRFKDNSSNNFAITVTGTPTVQAFDPFSPAASYGVSNGGSGYFNGSSQYLTTTANSGLGFGTGDFTVEYWVWPTSIANGWTVVDFRASTSFGDQGFTDYLDSGRPAVYYNPAASPLAISSIALKANSWNHVAFSRSSGTLRIFVDGVQGFSGSVTNNFGTSQPLGLGANINRNQFWNGYITNLRVVKGTAVYTSAFTPPTSPVTAITNTSLLLNFTNAGIYDAATLNDLVTVGNAQVSTAQAKFGSSSIAFDGTGDWLTFPDSPVMQLGTGNFTIEGWLYLPILGTARGIVSKGTSTTGWSVGVNLLNQFTFAYTTSTLTAATALTMGQWIHFAVVRNGSATGNVKIYFNGVLDATSGGAINDNFNQTSIGYVGADRVGTSPMNGYIDELRITKGYARYTSAFTPPTAPFPTR